MKIGDQLYSEKHGIVTITGKKYQMVGNKSVFVAKNEEGKEVKLDGTEIPLSDHFESVQNEEKMQAEEKMKAHRAAMEAKMKEEENMKMEEEQMTEKEHEMAEKAELIETIESIEEKTKDYTETFAEISKNIKDFSVKEEFEAVVRKFSEIKGSIDGIEKPKDYTDLFEKLITVVSKIKLEADLGPVEKKLNAILQKDFPAFPKFPEIPKFELPEVVKVETGLGDKLDSVIEDGRIKVIVDRVGMGGGGFTDNRVADSDSVIINPATEETLQSLLAASGGGAYETRIDEVSATVSYIGKATPGAATSAASWQITKLDETTGLVLSYADDVTTFTKIWDNRASYTY